MFNNIQIFITPLCPHRPTLSIISHHFQLQRVEASQCYLFENWWIKLKFPNLLKPLGTILQQNYQFFYPSQPFSFIHFNMMHPVLQSNFYPSNKQTNKQINKHFLISTTLMESRVSQKERVLIMCQVGELFSELTAKENPFLSLLSQSNLTLATNKQIHIFLFLPFLPMWKVELASKRES